MSSASRLVVKGARRRAAAQRKFAYAAVSPLTRLTSGGEVAGAPVLHLGQLPREDQAVVNRVRSTAARELISDRARARWLLGEHRVESEGVVVVDHRYDQGRIVSELWAFNVFSVNGFVVASGHQLSLKHLDLASSQKTIYVGLRNKPHAHEVYQVGLKHSSVPGLRRATRWPVFQTLYGADELGKFHGAHGTNEIISDAETVLATLAQRGLLVGELPLVNNASHIATMVPVGDKALAATIETPSGLFY